MKNTISTALLGCLILTTSACTSPGKRTGIGAAAGGLGGAAIGGAAGGWKGAAIGAGVGAIAGGAVGNRLDKQAKELEQVADAKRTDQGVMVNLKNDLLFETGKSDLKPEAIAQLSKVGDILTKYPEDRIQIHGFTDSTGSVAINETISQRRAQAVRDALASRGVQQSQMVVSGYGEERPVAPNTTSSGRAKNRRVELHIDIPPENQTA